MKVIPGGIDLNNLLNPSSQAPLPCCGRLCCKTMFYRPDERAGKVHDSDTAVHWCSLTQQPIGPDNRVVKPNACQPGRGCYEKA